MESHLSPRATTNIKLNTVVAAFAVVPRNCRIVIMTQEKKDDLVEMMLIIIIITTTVIIIIGIESGV